MLSPPGIFTNKSFIDKFICIFFSAIAVSIWILFLSNPCTILFGIPIVTSVSKVCTSNKKTFVPSNTGTTILPIFFSSLSLKKYSEEFFISFIPSSSILNTAISFVEPNLFLVLLKIR